MTTIRDQFNDPALGQLTKHLAEMPALEEYVKTASFDAEEIAALPASAFAWPEERRFPIHDPQHAALSAAYTKTASEIPAFVQANVQKAIEVYGVPAAVFETVKAAAHEENFEDWLCGDLKLFSVKNATETKLAQEQFLENYEKLDYKHRRDAGQNLVKKAAEHKVSVKSLTLKVAGMTVSHLPTLRDWVEARAMAATQPEHQDAFRKFASGLQAMPEESGDRHALMKIASGLAELDARAGLEKHYDRRLPDPLLSVFNTEKVAAETLDVAGKMIPLSKLAALPASFWTDLGGSELSDEVAPGGRVDPSKLATVLETLPMDLKVILKSQMRG